MRPTEWRIKRKSYADRVYEVDDGYVLGVAVLEWEGDPKETWAWGVSSHFEGANEPPMMGEGKATSMEDAMKKADECWAKRGKT